MEKLTLQNLILLRQCLATSMLELDEQGKDVSHYLKVADILDSEIDKKKSEREYELDADMAWKESTYYEQFKDNPSVEEGWKQNWMKVNMEEEMIGLIMANSKNENS